MRLKMSFICAEKASRTALSGRRALSLPYIMTDVPPKRSACRIIMSAISSWSLWRSKSVWKLPVTLFARSRTRNEILSRAPRRSVDTYAATSLSSLICRSVPKSYSGENTCRSKLLTVYGFSAPRAWSGRAVSESSPIAENCRYFPEVVSMMIPRAFFGNILSMVCIILRSGPEAVRFPEGWLWTK